MAQREPAGRTGSQGTGADSLPIKQGAVFGALAYVGLFLGGFPVDYGLFPPLFTGAFFAAIVAPYLVRVLPGWGLAYLIPGYAFAIGTFALVQVVE